jgi:dihydroorotate dehydrogenase
MHILNARPAYLLSANVPQMKLLRPSQMNLKVGSGNADAGGLNGQTVFPNPLDVLAAVVKLLGQDQALVGIVDAKGGNGVALHSLACSSEADIGSVKVKMGQSLIEPQARGLSQD